MHLNQSHYLIRSNNTISNMSLLMLEIKFANCRRIASKKNPNKISEIVLNFFLLLYFIFYFCLALTR